jgi:[ribosomal protein S5]-alanine N-acetyltransferase
MISDRLRYQPVEPESVDAFHSLVRDGHIRQYMMDGNLFSKELSEERSRESQSLFERRGVGIWLAYHKTTGELMGFCGFPEFPSMHPEPQLIYAMFERFSGGGYATEMASTMIALARKQAGFAQIFAGVDEVNIASLRVLEKLGLKRIATMQGSFGNMFLLQL